MTIYRANDQELRISTRAWKNPKIVKLERHRTIIETVQAHTGGADVVYLHGAGTQSDPSVFRNKQGTKFFVEKL